MKRTTTLALLALTCLTAIPSIAQARYRDGMNMYEYVRSEPIRHRDPSGRVTILIHGIDNRNWYSGAASAIKNLKQDEEIVEFKWDLSRPRTEITFGKNFILADSWYFHNMFPYSSWFMMTDETKDLNNMTQGLLKTTKLMNERLTENNRRIALDSVDADEKAGFQRGLFGALNRGWAGVKRAAINATFNMRPNRYVTFETTHLGAKVKSTFTELGLKLLGPLPPAGKSINLWAGGLFESKEAAAAEKLKKLLLDRNNRTDCDPIRVLAFSSGARILARTLSDVQTSWLTKSLERVVLVGASVSRNDSRIQGKSQKVYNYYSGGDFITRHIPRGGGAGSFPLIGKVENVSVEGMFHGDWMKGSMLHRYADNLIPENKRSTKRK